MTRPGDESSWGDIKRNVTFIYKQNGHYLEYKIGIKPTPTSFTYEPSRTAFRISCHVRKLHLSGCLKLEISEFHRLHPFFVPVVHTGKPHCCIVSSSLDVFLILLIVQAAAFVFISFTMPPTDRRTNIGRSVQARLPCHYSHVPRRLADYLCSWPICWRVRIVVTPFVIAVILFVIAVTLFFLQPQWADYLRHACSGLAQGLKNNTYMYISISRLNPMAQT